MEKAFSNRKTLVCQDGLARAAFCVSRWDSVAVLDRHSAFGIVRAYVGLEGIMSLMQLVMGQFPGFH